MLFTPNTAILNILSLFKMIALIILNKTKNHNNLLY